MFTLRFSSHSLRLVVFLPFLLGLAGLLAACKGKGETPIEEPQTTDSVLTDTANVDSTETEVVEVIPTKKADELFDDFAFAFMKNRYFQKKRIKFPLTFNNNGEVTEIQAKEWKFDRMFSQEEVYTLIFDSMKGEMAAKDTTLKHVTVEELNLETSHTKSYDFCRLDGEWNLVALSDLEMRESANSDFYTFYHQFATDPVFQQHHIAEQVEYTTFDDDAYETITGVISAEQFAEFSPELPKSRITNILYGQTYKNSKLRVLSIRGLSDGMQSNMVFQKINGEWMLTKLDN